MTLENAPGRETPSRWQSAVFHLKTRLFQVRCGIRHLTDRPPLHGAGKQLVDTSLLSEKRAPMWTDLSPVEFPLTAGKVHNIRLAARKFHGLEIPAGEVFSFWRQLGRTTTGRGFTAGRELREGCVVPAVGGGLCGLSGLLYQAALEAGLEIVERHAHSRIMPGSSAEQNLDATVFWNYVDLRFRSDAPWRLEVELTSSDIIVRIRAGERTKNPVPAALPALTPRAAPSGDCLSCGMTSCFRHPAATAAHGPALGHSTFLLDARWPELDRWCGEHSREKDRWFLPLDGHRWKKPNYQWSPPASAKVGYATFTTLWRSYRQRRLPAQGASRQLSLLAGEAELAQRYAAMLDPQCRHLVISQNLLPHLWQTGALGGRTFDVLIQRWPMSELQHRLDLAKAANPRSTTLGDFRADPDLMRAEKEALVAAGRLVTPHRDLARHFGHRAWRIEWEMPQPLHRRKSDRFTLFFPASRLGRKGAFELASAVEGMDIRLIYLGRATEGSAATMDGGLFSQGSPADLAMADALVIPAWIEHQPKLALLALASGIPVIASRACGLPEHPLLYELPSMRTEDLRAAILSLVSTPLVCEAC